MKTTSEDHDLIRWLDGEMNDAERSAFEARLLTDPALAKEAASLRTLSAEIRNHLPVELPVPHADFFNSQIQVRIAQSDDRKLASAERSTASLSALFRWFQQPWMTAASAVALAILAFVLLRPAGEDSSESLVLSSYTPNGSVLARAFHDSAAEATVLLLDGLDAIPSDKKISGVSARRSETELAATTLFDESGHPLLTISRDSRGNPLIWTSSPRG